MAPIDRRSFMARGAATAAGVAAAGLLGDVLVDTTAEAVTNGPGRNGISTKPPKKGGALIFGTDAEEQGFDPTSARFDEVGVMYARTVFDPLTMITTTGQVVPYLAQSVTPNPDYSSWTVTLRPNVNFHDGTPCNGAALLQNFNAQKDSELVGPVLAPILDSFVQTGPLTVQANFNQPWVPFPYYLAGQIGGQIGYVAAPAMLNNKNGTTHPIGTGPFIFEKWVPNDHFTANKNPNYWRPGYPYLNSITYRPIPDEDARSEALQSGTIDIMITDTPQIIVLYRGKKQWSYIDDSGRIVGEPDMNLILLNTGASPFNNAKVRLAAAKALSAAQYSRVIDIGVNAPSTGVFVPGTPYYSPTPYPAYDPSGARTLIQQVQHETGQPVSVVFGSTSGPDSVRAATYIQTKWENVGMKVSLQTFLQNDLINNALSGKFQAYEWRQFGAVNPDMNYIFWSSTTVGSEGNLSINMARNDDPILQRALELGRTATNPAIAAKAYQTVNKRFAIDLPYLFNDRAVWAVVSKPTVQNFNNPSAPGGQKGYGMIGGSIWPTQIWLS